MSPYQFGLAFRQYIAAFDGTNDLSPAKFKALFDKVYHKDLTYRLLHQKVRGDDGIMHLKARTAVTREEIFTLHSKHYARGQKIHLIHFRKIGMDCIDIKTRVIGDDETTVRVIHRISDGQAVLSREIDEGTPTFFTFSKWLARLNSKNYASGQKVTLVHYKKFLDCIDIKTRVVIGDEETTVRVVHRWSGGRLTASFTQAMDESFSPPGPVLSRENYARFYEGRKIYEGRIMSTYVSDFCRQLNHATRLTFLHERTHDQAARPSPSVLPIGGATSG